MTPKASMSVTCLELTQEYYWEKADIANIEVIFSFD